MRLPRKRFEQGCRAAAFALLGWLIGTSLILPTSHRVARATAATVGDHLVAWTRSAGTVSLHGEFAVTPGAWIVDWLSALRRSGHILSWSGGPPAVAMSVEALPAPNDRTRIDVSAPKGQRVVVSDEASTIDSVQVERLGARIVSPAVVGNLTALSGGQRFGAAAPDSAPARAVVVIGAASWEGKFIASALEERGWPVIARFSVAPKVEVTGGVGGQLTLDTARVSAVIATDTTIASYAEAVDRFVKSGGGLVLAGPASLSPSVASLRPGLLGTRLRPAVEPTDTIGLGSTGFYPVSRLEDDAIAIEQRPAGIAMAARRVGAGRVLQVGYDDSWRWRMAGGPGSEAAHREWWSRVVGSVAYAPPIVQNSRTGAGRAGTVQPAGLSAPLAYMVDRLGPARTGPVAAGRYEPLDRRILITLIMILLLAEWTSRRLRGLR